MFTRARGGAVGAVDMHSGMHVSLWIVYASDDLTLSSTGAELKQHKAEQLEDHEASELLVALASARDDSEDSISIRIMGLAQLVSNKPLPLIGQEYLEGQFALILCPCSTKRPPCQVVLQVHQHIEGRNRDAGAPHTNSATHAATLCQLCRFGGVQNLLHFGSSPGARSSPAGRGR
eukprot:6466238-Amphidinium_carterae.2